MVRKAAMFCILTTLVFAVVSCSKKPASEDTNSSSTITVVTPWDNTTREGVVKVTVDATDADGVNSVEVIANDRVIATLTTEPYECNWDLTSVADSTVLKLYARMVDGRGIETVSDTVTVTKGPTTTPVVTLISPISGTVSVAQGDSVLFHATATDGSSALPASAFTWTSDLQGEIQPDIWADLSTDVAQTPNNFKFRGLVQGHHTITVSATNNNGIIGSATTTVYVAHNTASKYAYIPAGVYYVGQPAFVKSKVTIPRSFWMSKSEVTLQNFYDGLVFACIKGGLAATTPKKNGYKIAFESLRERRVTLVDSLGCPAFFDTLASAKATLLYGSYPALYISYKEACLVCNAMSDMENLTHAYIFTTAQDVEVTGFSTSGALNIKGIARININFDATGYRLPTEAEWEVAARAGLVGKKYPWGDVETSGTENLRPGSTSSALTITQGAGPLPVNSLDPPNAFGIYDMAGNVSEMTSDVNSSILPSGYNPCNTSTVTTRSYILKGGNWNEYLGSATICNRSRTIPFAPGIRDASFNYGFRVVKKAQTPTAP